MDIAIDELRDGMNRLRGQLFEMFEAMGLPDKQEDAAKRLARRVSYSIQADVEGALRNARREHPGA